MRGKKATPGEGVQRAFEQFSYTKTPFGLKGGWSGWCAAEPYWCKAHEHKEKTPGTKVCVHWFTDGDLICPRCRPHVLPTTVAYVPIWREVDLKPCMVICHETVSDFLVNLGFGVHVVVGRADEGSSVYVKRTEDQPAWKSTLPYRQNASDITVSLQTMWGYPQLNEWMAAQERKTRNEQIADQEHRRSLPPKAPLVKLAEDVINVTSYPAAFSTGDIDAAREELVKRVERNARKNGKHKPED